MKIEKDGIIKELADEFMLADYIAAGWKLIDEKPARGRRISFDKEDK